MAMLPTCGQSPLQTHPESATREEIRRFRDCAARRRELADMYIGLGYTPEQIGIHNEKGGGMALYNELSAKGTYGVIDPACTYNWLAGTKSCAKGDVPGTPQPI